jgi:DNA transformation protein
MAVSKGFRDFVIDQLSCVGEVRPRAMFGGVGLYLEDLFFGVMADDVLYLKVDDASRAFFERAGSTPFRPYKDRPETMQYYNVPLGVVEDIDTLAAWARLALDAAHRKGASPPRKSRARRA